MKKFTTLVLAAAALLTANAQAFDRQAADEINQKIHTKFVSDAAVLDEAQKFLDSAQPQTDGEKMYCIALRTRLNFQRAHGKIAWVEHKKAVDDAIAAAKLTQPPSTAAYLEALYIWWNRSYDQEVYALMKTLPDVQTWHNAGHVCYALEKYEESYNWYLVNGVWLERAVQVAGDKLHDPARAFEAAKLTLTGNYRAATVKRVVENVTRFVIGQPGVPEEELKAFLVNLNRKCSVNMVKDRESWEPVVTIIRTLLETY